MLREFLAAGAHSYRCLILAPKRAEPVDFMRALAGALSDLAPGLLASFTAVYERVGEAPDAVRQIARWAAGQLVGVDATVLVDGLENAGDERLFGLLSELVDRTSAMPIRWIIITPDPTQLPLARWLANDRMDPAIDEVDLALTFADFRRTAGPAAPPAFMRHIRAVCTRAANWPAAEALLLSDPDAALPADGPSSQRHPYEYFATRAFFARTVLEQRFLLETCLFATFDEAVLAAGDWSGVDTLLSGLCDAGAFVFIDAAGVYRYAECFRAFLVNRLRAGAGELYARTATATAEVCCRIGRWSEALEWYTELGSAHSAARLLGEHGFELLDRGEAAVVSRALAALSEADFAAFPAALAVKASLESLYGSFDVAEAWFRHAIGGVDADARGALVFRYATDLVRRDRRDAIDLLRPVVERGGHNHNLAVSLAGLLATAYATHKMNAEAALTIERALRQLADVDDTSIHAKLYFQAGYVALFAGDYPRAKAFATRALDAALEAQQYDIAARALSTLYNVAMDYEDDIPATRRYLEQLASCSIKAGSRHLMMYATLGQYEIEVLAGNLGESARLDQTLKSLEIDYSVIATETLLPAQALRATWSGDFHRAYRLIAPTAQKQITPIRQAQRYAEIALYAAAAGLREEALCAARRALATAPKIDPPNNAVAFTKAYVALALTLLGRGSRAEQLLLKLRRSASLSARFAQVVETVATVNARWTRGHYSTGLRGALDRLDACDFGGIGRLIEALPLPETFRGQLAGLNVLERDVLIHLSAGLDASEIAAISKHRRETVQANIESICRKLGGTSARHAVALAQNAEPQESAAVYGA